MEKKEDFYCIDVEIPNVKFGRFHDDNQVHDIHHAHLYFSENEIELRIFYDGDTYFGDKLAYWITTIDLKKFGSFLKITGENTNPKLLKVDLSDAELCGLENSTSYYEGDLKYVIIRLSTVKLYWSPLYKDDINTAEFYLSDVGFRVVEPFYSFLSGYDGKFNIDRMTRTDAFYSLGKSEFRPEFNTYSRDKKSNRIAEVIKEPKIQFKYKKNVSENEAILYGNIVSYLASFYHHIKIDYSYIRICLPEHTIIIKKIEKKNYFDTSRSLYGFNNYWTFPKFLQSDWQEGTLKNFKLLSKVIELFNQALLVDSNSEFLIRYNIIEICNNLKQDTVKFNFSLKGNPKKKKFKSALELLLETIDPSEHKQFKNKWSSLLGKLEYKPMISPLITFLESQQLNVSEFPITVSELNKLRNDITHGSIDKIDREQLRKTNQFLYRINGILILNLMGIKEWKLNVNLT